MISFIKNLFSGFYLSSSGGKKSQENQLNATSSAENERATLHQQKN